MTHRQNYIAVPCLREKISFEISRVRRDATVYLERRNGTIEPNTVITISTRRTIAGRNVTCPFSSYCRFVKDEKVKTEEIIVLLRDEDG